MTSLIIALIAGLPLTAAVRVLFGVTVRRIMSEKGYSGNWFWLGFFFEGLALLFTLAKPDLRPPRREQPPGDAGSE